MIKNGVDIPVNALIIKKEYLDLILSGEKVVKLMELRSQMVHRRGRISLIESGSGLIVGEVVICDCIEFITRSDFEKYKSLHLCHIGFFDKYRYGWLLEPTTAKRYDTPIPYNHPQGAVIWVTLNEERLAV